MCAPLTAGFSERAHEQRIELHAFQLLGLDDLIPFRGAHEMSVAENVVRVREAIETARERGGGAEPVTLVAVTKGRAAAAVRDVLAAGVADIGENRVQEARAKWPALGFLDSQASLSSAGESGLAPGAALSSGREGCASPASRQAGGGPGRPTLHLIGHLQRNKAAQALELFDVIQSVDSLRLARKISQLALGGGRRVSVLVQVNGGEEDPKHGFPPAALADVLPEIAALPALEVAGVMVLAPLEAPERRLREIFRGVRETFESLRRADTGRELRHLSMGMSSDFEIAVEEGANMVRIGSALFDGT
jgi:uncharacterized pyridoxal phosphate-containing UPF0001 family protein